MDIKETLVNLAMAFYRGEPCRICGELIGDDNEAVYAGYSKDNKARSAHGKCWHSNTPKEDWLYSEDAQD